LTLSQAVKKNYKKALHYYIKACNNNYIESCYFTGAYYERGIGIEKNINTAKAYYKKACDNGIKDACKALKKIKPIDDTTYSYLKIAFFFLLILFITYRTGKKEK